MIKSKLTLNKKGLLANVIGLFVAILIGLSLLPIINDKINEAIGEYIKKGGNENDFFVVSIKFFPYMYCIFLAFILIYSFWKFFSNNFSDIEYNDYDLGEKSDDDEFEVIHSKYDLIEDKEDSDINIKNVNYYKKINNKKENITEPNFNKGDTFTKKSRFD